MLTQAVTKKLPTYLNESFIKTALEKSYGASITIRECDIKLASSNGENYCSDIYRARVAYQCGEQQNGFQTEVREKSLILKDMLKELSALGSNETYMYQKVLPEMEKILKEAGIEVKLKADCLMVDHVDKELYVMEDLNALGYLSEDRWTGLNLEKSKVLLKKLAQWHASSMIFSERFPAELANLQGSHFEKNDENDPSHAIAMGGINYTLKIIESWEDFEDIAEKMRAIIPKFDDKIKEISKPEHVKVKVITHGDLWVNNVLFNSQKQDAIFVDFQNCFQGSPGYDIDWFLNTSVQLDVLKNERYTLLRYYFKVLKDTLKACGAKQIPTWQSVMEEVRNCEFLGFYTAVCEMPICCMNKEAAHDFTVKTFSDPVLMAEKYPLLYGSERVLNTLRYTLDRFNELGVLD